MGKAKTATETAAEQNGQAAAFRKYAARAKALPAEQVKVRGDAQLALENAKAGLAAVLAEEWRAILGKFWLSAAIEALKEVVPLAQAAVFAASRAGLVAGPATGLLEKIKEAYALRDKLLADLDNCVKHGILVGEKADEVAKLHRGRGALNAAQGLVHIAQFWRANAGALNGKTLATEEDLARAEALGNELVDALRPKGSRRRTDPVKDDASDTANRHWTLLAQGYENVLKAGFTIWSRAYEEHTPPLGSRAIVKHRQQQGDTGGTTEQIQAEKPGKKGAKKGKGKAKDKTAGSDAPGKSDGAGSETPPQTPPPSDPSAGGK